MQFGVKNATFPLSMRVLYKVVGCTCLGWFIISGKANAINTYNMVMISISPIVMTLGWFMKLGLPSPLKFTSRGQGQLASCRFFWIIYIYIIFWIWALLVCLEHAPQKGTYVVSKCCSAISLHFPRFTYICCRFLLQHWHRVKVFASS